ncbi:MAG: bifunctional metallophosphatase/5'-nucleotidase, partial [Lentisphaeria bacterium]|nr:bifunctional metallophosphatase/5'-nucleotidase [Lentisphaeria bacterium]
MACRRFTVFLLAVLCLSTAAGTVRVRILQTTDLHAFVRHGDDPAKGGWLRLATLIRRERDAGTLLIDCGDTCQGTLTGVLSQGEVAISLLHALKYDVWVPGNHELDFGIPRCAELCRMAGTLTLCGNMDFPLETPPLKLPAWRMFERNGARVAVIGATASYMRNWLLADQQKRISITLAADMLRRIMPEVLGARPDMIVLATHQGWLTKDPREVNEVPAVVEQFPEIDLILGGHTHWARPGVRLGKSTWYVQTGAHAAEIAVIDAMVDTVAHKVVDISSRLLEATADVELDPEAKRAVQKWIDQVEQAEKQPVGHAAAPVLAKGLPGVSCATSELLSAAISEDSGATVVMHGRLSRAGLREGPITQADLFALVPYENSVVTAWLTPGQLARIVAEQYANRRSYVYCGVWGAEVQMDRDGGAKVLRLAHPGKKIDGRVLVAFNSYTAAGGGGRFPVLKKILDASESRTQTAGKSSRKALERYVRKHNPLRV